MIGATGSACYPRWRFCTPAREWRMDRRIRAIFIRHVGSAVGDAVIRYTSGHSLHPPFSWTGCPMRKPRFWVYAMRGQAPVPRKKVLLEHFSGQPGPDEQAVLVL